MTLLKRCLFLTNTQKKEEIGDLRKRFQANPISYSKGCDLSIVPDVNQIVSNHESKKCFRKCFNQSQNEYSQDEGYRYCRCL